MKFNSLLAAVLLTWFSLYTRVVCDGPTPKLTESEIAVTGTYSAMLDRLKQQMISATPSLRCFIPPSHSYSLNGHKFCSLYFFLLPVQYTRATKLLNLVGFARISN